MPPTGRPPTKIPQHKKECLTTEEAKAVYECLHHDQVVSPIHFSKDLPKLYSLREAAYDKLDKLLEEKGPLNPYEFALLNPHEEFPVNTPVLEDFYDMGGLVHPQHRNSLCSPKELWIQQSSCHGRRRENPRRMGIIR